MPGPRWWPLGRKFVGNDVEIRASVAGADQPTQTTTGTSSGPAPYARYGYLDHLRDLSDEDVEGLLKAQESYGDSWKQRGGVGAFMMLARKWDRIQNVLRVPGSDPLDPAYKSIFTVATEDTRSEGIIDDIRDLRRYLLLVEGELRSRGIVHGRHRDNS